MLEINKIYNENCLDTMSRMTDNIIDLTVTSPPYDCYSKDTEVLTEDGWKLIKNVSVGEMVLTLNPKTKKVYYGKVVNTFCYKLYNEEMIHFYSTNIDLIVTKNHKMYVTDKDGNPARERIPFVPISQLKSFYLREAKDVKMGNRLEYSGFKWYGIDKDYFTLPAIDVVYNKQPTYFPELKIRMKDWVKFFGLYIAEGSSRGSRGGKREVYGINIKQKKGNGSDVVKTILDGLPFIYKMYEHNNLIQFSITNCQLWHYLKQFGNSHQKYIPNEIKNLHIRHLTNFLYYYLFGDGTKRMKPLMYYFQPNLNKNDVRILFGGCRSCSIRLKDDLQEICIKCGFIAKIDGYDALGFTTYKQLKYDWFKKEIVNYTGKIYSLQVEKDNIIFIRRNGKPLFCGNSLRTYKGFKWNFEEVAKQLYRITKLGGVVVWVVGDAIVEGSETGTSFKQALYFKECGFNLHDTMIYQKTSSSLPDKTRYSQVFEYMFIFTKGKIKTFNPIIDKPNKQAGSTNPTKKRKTNGQMVKTQKYYTIPLMGKRTNIWTYEVGYNKGTKDKIAFQHPATFPEKLAEDCVKSWSNKEDLILDPFIGSGTTSVACKKLNRNYIGIEISKDYCEIARNRTKKIVTLRSWL